MSQAKYFLLIIYIFCSYNCILASSVDEQDAHLLLFCMDAPNLDYSNLKKFLETMSKHPDSYNKEGRVGHAWFCLLLNGNPQKRFEVGHTGEMGVVQPKFFNGVLNYNYTGYFDGNESETTRPFRFEPNPIRYLFSTLHDGYLQYNSGGHRPNAVYGCWITDRQKDLIIETVDRYPSNFYSLTQYQCCRLVEEVASVLGLELKSSCEIYFERALQLSNDTIRLWKDVKYSKITVRTVDALYKSIEKYSKLGVFEDYTSYYMKKIYKRKRKPLLETILRFPERYQRLNQLRNCKSVY